ncbi:hypothetical protein KEM52_004450, partial [Ascosphaera acerosa]
EPRATLQLRGSATPPALLADPGAGDGEAASDAARRQGTPSSQAQSQAQAQGLSVRWAEDVVDNEGMGKKQSKGLVCCIYRKPTVVGESSSESDSDSDSESDSSSSSSDGDSDSHGHGHGHGGDPHDENHRACPRHRHSHGSHRTSRPRPNAYERQPKYKPQQ